MTAVFAAALVPAVLFGAKSIGSAPFEAVLVIFAGAFLIALLHSLIIGFPLFLYLESIGRANIVVVTSAGFMVACVPISLINLPALFIALATFDPQALQALVLFGSYGALGAFAFATIMQLPLRASRRGMRHVRETSNSGRSNRKKVLWIALAGALTPVVLIIVLPGFFEDRSCHNLLRGERTSIGPEVGLTLNLAPGDWANVTEILRQLATRHGLDVRNQSRGEPYVLTSLHLSLCSDAGVNVTAHAWNVTAEDAQLRFRQSEVFVGVYRVRDDAVWKPLARDAIAVLTDRWPSLVSFNDATGQSMPIPDELKAH